MARYCGSMAPPFRLSRMHAPMSFAVILLVIGAAQALLLAIAVRVRRENAAANRILSVLLALIAVNLSVVAGYQLSPAPSRWLFVARALVSLFPFLYASAFYLYARTLTTTRRPSRSDLLHLGGLALLMAWALDGAIRLRYDALQGTAGLWAFKDVAMFAYGLPYVAASVWLGQRYRRALMQQHSTVERRHALAWVGWMALGQAAIWGLGLVNRWLPLPGGSSLVYGAISTWICVLGYISLTQPAAEPHPEIVEPLPSREEPEDPRAVDVEARLASLMQDHALYREPALTIGQVAKRSGYPEYLVSAVINRRLGGNFWEYVNRLRVEAACAALADPEDDRSVLDIAYDAGFTSKSTFNAAFKRLTGKTPSAFRHGSLSAGGQRGATATRTPAG